MKHSRTGRPAGEAKAKRTEAMTTNITDRQLQGLQSVLLEREDYVRQEIKKNSRERTEVSQDMIENVGDDADKSVADLIVHVDNALIGERLIELQEISAAR